MSETAQNLKKASTKALVDAKGRYRSLILSIVIFLSLIGALLVYTFYTSSILQKNTALINSANKVAYDTQSVIKDLFDMQNSYGEDISSPHIRTVLARLKNNTTEIDEVLALLENGGNYTTSDGTSITVPQVTESDILPVLHETKKQWLELKPKVNDYLKVASNIQVDSSTALAVAGEQAKTSSLAMNQSLFTLTERVFASAERQAATIRFIQLIGVAVILAYFAIFIFFFVRRLRESDIQTDEARRETKEIMENVTTGLFLLDRDLKIGQQHSKALESIVGTQRLAGEDLTNVLRGRISDKDLTTTRQFVEQLYNARVKEKLVEDLNPLKKVLVHDANSSLGSSRYLDFKFSRVYEDKDIARILVNVSDVSDAVRLEQRLEKERQQNEMQIEMLTTVLNVEPSMIQSFIVNTKQYIEKMNNILKNPGSTQSDLEAKITAIYREMHSLKGESSALKLQSFTALASDAETTLTNLRQQPRLTGNDFLPLTVQLDALLNLSMMIESLGQRIGQAFSNTDYTALQNLKTDDDEEAFSQSHLDLLEERAKNQLQTETISSSVETQTESDNTVEQVEIETANINHDEIDASVTADVGQEEPSALPPVDVDAVAVESEPVDTVEQSSPVAEPTSVEKPVETSQSLEDLANRLFDDEPSVNHATPVMAASAVGAVASEAVKSDTPSQLQYYAQFVQDVAARQNRRVRLESDDYEDVKLPVYLESAVREITMQLLKNAVVHGIERHIERIADGKPATGTISFSQKVSDQKLHLEIADDGRGIDYDKIRAKLIEMGTYDEESIHDVSEQSLVDHLFESGFSTKDAVDEDAGRGVGMDIIRARIEEHNGEITVQSEQGKYTRFVIYIPV